jgi:hypothetical protein
LSRAKFRGCFILFFFTKTSKKFEANSRNMQWPPPKTAIPQATSASLMPRGQNRQFFFFANSQFKVAGRKT